MKFQTLKKSNKKNWIVGSIVVISLVATITFMGSRAKYRSSAHTSLAKGVINYNYDLDIVAVNIQNVSGEYVSSAEVPTSGYTLNKEKSHCKVGNEKVNVSMEYKGKVYISTSEKGTKCELYFDKSTFKTKDLILSHNTIDSIRMSGTFASTYSANTAGIIFNSIDDDGETFFFAGSNPNNWVQFGTNKEGQELYWRIIRINGDESIRIIYNGPTTDKEGESTQIGASPFNTDIDDNAYVGYMYGTPGSKNYADTHANTNSSTIKTYLDAWYEENFKKNYGNYIDINAGFCGDRQTYAGLRVWNVNYTPNGYGKEYTMYSYGRIAQKNKFPATYKCAKDNDLYTLTTSNKGNKSLTYPIGLVTSDELIYAGVFPTWNNIQNNWVVTNQSYWTMTPTHFDGSAVLYSLLNEGTQLNALRVSQSLNDWGVRPVINLKADVLKVGFGTTTDPYRIN